MNGSDERFRFEHIHLDTIGGGYNSESFHRLLVYLVGGPAEPVGVLDYSWFQDRVYIKDIRVAKPWRRRGVAKALMWKLQDQAPWHEIEHGMTTPDGTALRQAMEHEMAPWYARGVDHLGRRLEVPASIELWPENLRYYWGAAYPAALGEQITAQLRRDRPLLTNDPAVEQVEQWLEAARPAGMLSRRDSIPLVRALNWEQAAAQLRDGWIHVVEPVGRIEASCHEWYEKLLTHARNSPYLSPRAREEAQLFWSDDCTREAEHDPARVQHRAERIRVLGRQRRSQIRG